MSDEYVENLKQPSAWLRVLFMAGFVLALYVSGIILLVLMLAQILFSLITGADNTNLRRLGSSLTLYVSQILRFLTYNSENKPFPFAQFPLATDDEIDDVTAADSGVAEPRPTPQREPATASPETGAETETAADSAAGVMAESAARRATRSASKTPRAVTASSVANTGAVTDSSVTNSPATKTRKSPRDKTDAAHSVAAADAVADAGPEIGVTDVVDKQANDV